MQIQTFLPTGSFPVPVIYLVQWYINITLTTWLFGNQKMSQYQGTIPD